MVFIVGKLVRVNFDGNVFHHVPEFLGNVFERLFNEFFEGFSVQSIALWNMTVRVINVPPIQAYYAGG